MRTQKVSKIIIFILFIFLVLLSSAIFMFSKNRKYSVNEHISKYNLTRFNEDKYIDFLKSSIYPEKLRGYIKNEFVDLSWYNENATGNDVLLELYHEAYENLFLYIFNKHINSFDDCPVTNNFKNKFNTNLLYYYSLDASDDCEVNCNLDIENKKVTVEVYGNFENTEPTYWNTHLFTYTLDSDGNIDDVVPDNK